MTRESFDPFEPPPRREQSRRADVGSTSLMVEAIHSERSRSIVFLLVDRSLPGFQNSLYYKYDGAEVYGHAAVPRPKLAMIDPPPLRSFMNELLEVQSLEVYELGLRKVSVRYGTVQNYRSVLNSFVTICAKTFQLDGSSPVAVFHS